jgi:acyl-phosphate glycerol 3-phosphate acyltransferase
MEDLVAVALGYLAGSVPFAYLLSRRRGIDLREVGSGNVGATNVLRTSGVGAAVAAMCLDALKGSLAVVIAARLVSGTFTPVEAGVASIVGHTYPVCDGPAIVAIGAALAAVVIVHRHRGNLARLVAGTERRIGQRLF